MQAKKRYILLMLSCAFLAYCYFGGYRLKSAKKNDDKRVRLKTFSSRESLEEMPERHVKNPSSRPRACRMETCFDFSRCGDNPKVYVYPNDGPISMSYAKVLSVVRESRYATDDPKEACLFLPGVDTLDADPLSTERVTDVALRLARLPHWNGGRNHLVFNLYAGTWPNYHENALGFDPGEAILARASASENVFRNGFDVSLPLFHKQHPEKGGMPPSATTNLFPAPRKHLLAFKGKRYVHGIGSETRNALWHLHDGKDLVLVTTCRHGKSWREMQDERCDEDNREYDRFDYEQLLSNSTFCVVARGRRLGSYRFLEALAAGCVPVLLSNGWRLPFDERLDWRRAVLWADERLVLQVPELARSVSAERILALRQHTQLYWDLYFSSVDKIVHTTIEIILERVTNYRKSRGREWILWNAGGGGLNAMGDYGDSAAHYPWDTGVRGAVRRVRVRGRELGPPLPAPPGPSGLVMPAPPTPGTAYTALVYAQADSPSLHRLLANLAASLYCEQVVVVREGSAAISLPEQLQRRSRPPLPVLLLPDPVQSSEGGEAGGEVGGAGGWWGSGWRACGTAGVFLLPAGAPLLPDELDYAFLVWTHFPHRLVGYAPRNHYWDALKGAWGYTSRWGGSYSLMLAGGGALVHRQWAGAAGRAGARLAAAVARAGPACAELLLNVVVGAGGRAPPLQLGARRRARARSAQSPPAPRNHFVQRASCLNTLAHALGRLPLPRSRLRLDPALYLDPVSNLRKKYRRMELPLS